MAFSSHVAVSVCLPGKSAAVTLHLRVFQLHHPTVSLTVFWTAAYLQTILTESSSNSVFLLPLCLQYTNEFPALIPLDVYQSALLSSSCLSCLKYTDKKSALIPLDVYRRRKKSSDTPPSHSSCSQDRSKIPSFTEPN
jgi:hypothetical protein